jgi:hypothetical protein
MRLCSYVLLIRDGQSRDEGVKESEGGQGWKCGLERERERENSSRWDIDLLV